MLELLDFYVQSWFERAWVVIGVVLVLRKIVNMTRFHELRVFFLTSVLSLIVVYLFVVCCFPYHPCVVDLSVPVSSSPQYPLREWW
jgi:hypothetical protein